MRNLMLLCLMMSGPAYAAPMKRLVCGSGAIAFEGTLDYGRFVESSGLFDVRDAFVRNNYATARLLCTGNRIGEIACVGFWFNSGQMVVRVTVSGSESKSSACARTLLGPENHDFNDLDCVISDEN